MLIEVSHSELLASELPKQWHLFWRHILSRQAAAVYLALRVGMGKEFDLDRLAAALKMSKTGLMKGLKELEENGFVSLPGVG